MDVCCDVLLCREWKARAKLLGDGVLKGLGVQTDLTGSHAEKLVHGDGGSWRGAFWSLTGL